jgi:polysaccharide biosynthesis protein PslH
LKILYLTSRFPFPLDKGDKLRAYHQIKTLSARAEVYLASISENDTPKEQVAPLLPYTCQCHLFRITQGQRIRSLATSAWSDTPLQTAWFYSRSIHKELQTLAETIMPDLIVVQLARMAAYNIDYPCPKILDYMDAFGIGMLRRAAISRGLTKVFYQIEGKRMLKYEGEIAANFDRLWIISAQDRDQIKRNDALEINVIPNGIDPSFLSYDDETKKEFDLLFVGNMSYLPNIEAAIYLVEKILPLSPKGLKLEIAGISPDKRVKTLASASINVTGFVPDIRTAYARGRIFCAPLWSGTGQQNKILEAMAMGIPCITTTSVNLAIGGEHLQHILIADDAHSFADAIRLLLENEVLYKSISSKGRQFVAEKYRWETLLSEITKTDI